MKTWETVLQLLNELKTGGLQIVGKTKDRVPGSLFSGSQKTPHSWVSNVGATLPNGALPLTPENEKSIVAALITDLNGLYNLGLGDDPSVDRLCEVKTPDLKPNILLIGASHVSREGDILADRGHTVTICSKPGWRPNRGSVDEMVERVKTCLADMRPNDVVFIQCLDNSVYMARTEEDGDLPIRKYPDGDYHVEGYLILVAKDRQYLVFNILLPLLRLLEGRKVIFVTPMPRYLEVSCCDELEHAPNRYDGGFEKRLRDTLAEYRQNFKHFIFTSGLRGITVIDPSPATMMESEPVWGEDPVHPLTEGYERVVDLFEATMVKMDKAKTGIKRPAEEAAGSKTKKARQEVSRPGWIFAGTSCKQQVAPTGWRGGRGGSGGGRGGGRGYHTHGQPYRGGSGYQRGFQRGRGGSY